MVQMTEHGRDDLIEIIESLATVEEVIRDVAREDPDVRAALGRLALWLGELAAPVPEETKLAEREVGGPRVEVKREERTEVEKKESEEQADRTDRDIDVDEQPPETAMPIGEALLTLGGAMRKVPARGTEKELDAASSAEPRVESDGVDIEEIGRRVAESTLRGMRQRLLIKAELCRWLRDMPQLSIAVGPIQSLREITPPLYQRVQAERDMISFIKRLHAMRPSAEVLGRLAGCFGNVARMLRILSRLEERGVSEVSWRRPCYELLAEALCALRVQTERLNGWRDEDQGRAFAWLRNRTKTDQIRVDQYMKLSHEADPGEWRTRKERIAKLSEDVDASLKRADDCERLIRRVGLLTKQIDSGTGDDQVDLWEQLDECVTKLCRHHAGSKHRQLKRLLASVLHEVPVDDELSHESVAALEAAKEWARTQNEAPERVVTHSTPAVTRVRRVLEGRRMLIIGGDRRDSTVRALKREFRLGGVEWLETRSHTSVETFRAPIRRDGVAVVLLLIRWSSHSYGEAKQMCDEAGRPLVYIPAGYGVNRVAAEICSQAIDRLETTHQTG